MWDNRSHKFLWTVAFCHFKGDLVILDILKTRFSDWLKDLIDSRCREDLKRVITDVRLLEWIRINWPDFSLPLDVVINIVKLGHLEALRFMFDRGIAAFDPKLYQTAWEASQVDMLLYLLETQQEPWPPEFLALVAGVGHLELLKLLHKTRGLHGLGVAVMNKAAGGGHVEVVQFLHEHTDVQCSTDVMDYAAAHGHLDVVKFLHEHRSEGCTMHAMDRSAE